MSLNPDRTLFNSFASNFCPVEQVAYRQCVSKENLRLNRLELWIEKQIYQTFGGSIEKSTISHSTQHQKA